MVLYDGEKIVVSVSKNNYSPILDLMNRYEGQYLAGNMSFVFNPCKRLVIELMELTPKSSWDSNFTLLSEKVSKQMAKLEEMKQMEIQQKQVDIDSQKYNIPESFYPFQKQDVTTMIQMDRNILLADSMGLGKSAQAITVLNNRPDLLPALIICPASLKRNWDEEFRKWAPKLKTFIISGMKPEYSQIASAGKADVIIINYDILGKDDVEAKKLEEERKLECEINNKRYKPVAIPVVGWVDELIKLNVRCIVCDECQYIQSTKAIRSRGVRKIAEDRSIKKLFLSGTPYETRTSQFFNSLNLLAPDLFPDEWAFKYRYCNPVKTFFGWTFNGLTNADELKMKLSNFMIRRTMDEVLPQLPKNQREVVYLDISDMDRRKYEKVEDEILGTKGIKSLEAISKMNDCLLEIKKDLVVQYIKDILEVEDKIVVFVYHTKLYDELMTKFSKIAVGINGSVSNDDRQTQVHKFQEDDKIRLFVGQIKAAGTGITLTKAHFTIFAEFGQTVGQHTQAEHRTRRIGQTSDHVLSQYLVVKDSIDEDRMGPLEIHNRDITVVMDDKKEEEVEALFDLNQAAVVRCMERVTKRKKPQVVLEYETK